MPWVKSEYASEFAVLSAWLAALVPWSATVHWEGPPGTIMFVLRFPLAELQFRGASQEFLLEVMADVYPGTPLVGGAYVTDPITAALTYELWSLQLGSVVWTLGTVVVLAAVVLSLALYRDEAAVADRLPYHHVRVMGGLLAVAAASFAVATVLYSLGRTLVGVPFPLGVVVVGALALALLRVDLV